MTGTQDTLKVALASLVPQDEHFLDYITVTTHSPMRPKKLQTAERADMQAYALDLARRAVAVAQTNLVAEDVPFRCPDDFTPEMFRPGHIMDRLGKISARKAQELRLQQEVRKRRFERQRQAALQHGKKVGRHAAVRLQREVIEAWKAERAAQARQGVSEEKLPRLEDVEKKYRAERRIGRLSKNMRYGGKKMQKQAQKQFRRAKRQLQRAGM